MNLDALLARLDGLRETGANRWIARCPSHDDRSPSLSIRDADSGRILLHCFAGCETEDVLASVGLSFADVMPEPIRGQHSFKPQRQRFDARAALECVYHESLVVAVLVVVFSLAGATIGMAEEYIPLVAILITLCVGMRMDTVAAVGIMVVGYGIGYGTAVMNPFTVLVAQEVAGLTPVSGIGYRLAIFLPFFALGFYHVLRYAKMIRNDPSRSLVADVPEAQPPGSPEPGPISGRQALVLAATLVALIIVVWGIKVHQWYFVELGGIFFALALVCGLIYRMRLDDMAVNFIAGAGELIGTALLIGFARAIEITLSDGQVLHTIVNGLSQPLVAVGPEISAIGMLFIQSILNFFVPSGSGQAYVTMPIMAPISDIVGVSRQVAVLAYQMGDGFMNMIVPTNAVLMGILGICGIPYGRWFRFIWPLMLQLLVLGSISMAVAVMVGYQ